MYFAMVASGLVAGVCFGALDGDNKPEEGDIDGLAASSFSTLPIIALYLVGIKAPNVISQTLRTNLQGLPTLML
jgi:hypothetical protein